MTMQRNLEGRVALVTGAASGMGRTHALVLAARGAKLVLGDVQRAGLDETLTLVTEAGGEAIGEVVDVADATAVNMLVEHGRQRFGYVDVVVNNAGYGQKGDLEDIGPDELSRMLAVHVGGAFNCTRAALADMKNRRYGKILNVSSMWAMSGWHTASHYCTAKAALLGATKAWARELAPWNINVNAIAPGGVLTPPVLAKYTPEQLAAREQGVPAGRYSRPEEQSWSVAFLVSPEADFITGQVLSANGGEAIVGI